MGRMRVWIGAALLIGFAALPAGPARALGLASKGNLGVGGDAHLV